MNDHVAVADRLRRIFRVLQQRGVAARLILLGHDESFAEFADPDKYEIDVAVLANMLTEADGRFD